MRLRAKVLIASGVVTVIASLVVVNLRREGSKIEVRVSEVSRRDITKYITASGRIQPARKVDVSASSIGKITRLAVREGDVVEKGDFLLEIDPIDFVSAVGELGRARLQEEVELVAATECGDGDVRHTALSHEHLGVPTVHHDPNGHETLGGLGICRGRHRMRTIPTLPNPRPLSMPRIQVLVTFIEVRP